MGAGKCRTLPGGCRRSEADYDHTVIDTGPQRQAILRQALMVTDDLVVTVAPSPSSWSSCPTRSPWRPRSTPISPTFAQVLFVKVRRGTRSSVEARRYLTERELPVMAAEIHLLECNPLAYGTVPADLAEYEAVVKELGRRGRRVMARQRAARPAAAFGRVGAAARRRPPMTPALRPDAAVAPPSFRKRK